jgi:hypothetical protein
MISVCTVADSNFLLKFLALRESIKKHTEDYSIKLLCLDQSMYDILNDKFDDVDCFNIRDLRAEDSELDRSRDNDPSYEAVNVSSGDIERAKEIQFTWAMASYFSWYCIEKLNLEDILYVDADIYFFNDPSILEDFKDFGSIGIIENRVEYSPVNGKYNVGIVFFKNDKSGRKCSEFWKNCLLNSKNKYAEGYGTCGDQKYLELFPVLFEDVFEYDNFIGHLAPWSVNNHMYLPDKKISWGGKIQNLLFYHFSNFSYNFENETYSPAGRHGITNAYLQQNPYLKSLYEEYYRCLEELNENSFWNDSL